MNTSIGIVELTSIAAGFNTGDVMLKAAGVELLLMRSVCSGKYIIMVSGEVGAVRQSVEAGETAAGFALVDSFIIPNVHPDILPAVRGGVVVNKREALGILESFSVSSLIEGADAAAKAGNVEIIDIRLAMALGGKAYATMTGTVADVTSAIDAGAEVIGKKGLLVNKYVIPNPRDEVYQEII